MMTSPLAPTPATPANGTTPPPAAQAPNAAPRADGSDSPFKGELQRLTARAARERADAARDASRQANAARPARPAAEAARPETDTSPTARGAAATPDAGALDRAAHAIAPDSDTDPVEHDERAEAADDDAGDLATFLAGLMVPPPVTPTALATGARGVTAATTDAVTTADTGLDAALGTAGPAATADLAAPGRFAALGDAAGAHRRSGPAGAHAKAGGPAAAKADSTEPGAAARSLATAPADDPTRHPDAAPVSAVTLAAPTTAATTATTPGADAVIAGTAPAGGPAAAGPEAPAAPLAEATLRAPFDGVEFAPALGHQIAHFARDGIEHARVHLNPAEMGPIAVQLSMDGAQVRVDLVADQSATRQALEQSLPALAGALREAGFTLAGGGVFQQARDGGNTDGRADPGAASRGGGLAARGEAAGAADPVAARPSSRPRGLVDLVA